MMSSPTVSVVIPTYNDSATLGAAVRSVLAQTFEDLEVTVVDDGSAEDIATPLRGLNDPRLSVLRHEQNKGAAAARNTGVFASGGEYVAFLDADDEWFPEKLAVQLNHIQAQSDQYPVNCTNYYLHRVASGEVSLRSADRCLIETRDLAFGCALSPGTTLFAARQAFEKVGPFDESMPRLEDWDWLIRCTRHWPIAIVPQALACVHSEGWPTYKYVDAATRRLRSKHIETFRDQGFGPKRSFLAALSVERSAAAYRERRFGKAASLLAKSFLDHPYRKRSSLIRLARTALGWSASRESRPGRRDPSVMHVITSLHRGGAEGMLTRLALANARSGQTVTVASLTPGGPHADQLSQAGVAVVNLGIRTLPHALWAIARLAILIRRIKPDVVQGWMYHGDLFALLALWLSGRRSRTRIYWGVRCSDMNFSRYGLGLRILVRICAWLSSWPNAVVANSEAGMQVHRALGYRPREFMLIDNGIDPEQYRPDDAARIEVRGEMGVGADTPLVAMVARVDPMKDHETFLAAFARLSHAKGVLIGKDTEALDPQPNLRRLGRRTDIPRLLAACDILVSSSAFGEGFSNALAEAMATGIPVVATDVGDARRVIGDAGVVVPPRDPEALAQAIQSLIDAPEKRRVMGAHGRDRMCTLFPLDRAIVDFGRLYSSST